MQINELIVAEGTQELQQKMSEHELLPAVPGVGGIASPHAPLSHGHTPQGPLVGACANALKIRVTHERGQVMAICSQIVLWQRACAWKEHN